VNDDEKIRELLKENGDLRRKLDESNGVVNAIRNGEVDGLLINNDQVYVLKGADHVYRQIVEEMQEGYLTLDCNGFILFCNRNLAKMVHQPLEQVIGMKIFDMLASSDQELLRLYMQNETLRFKTEFTLKTADKLAISVLVSTKKCTIDAERYVCMLITDITEQKRNERFMRQIFNQAVEAIIVCDEIGRIVKANRMATKLFGSELLSNVFDRVVPLYLESDDKRFLITDAVQNGVTYGTEVRYTNPKGKPMHLLVSVGRLIGEEPGEMIGFLVTIADIAESRNFVREITRLDRLNIIGQTAAGIGHEVRNPMTTVRGYLQMFKEKPPFLPYNETLDIMIDELDRANMIISEFLSLAKNKNIKRELISLNKVIHNIFPLIQADAFQSGNGIELALDDIPDVLADEKEMRQCIFNLVRNGFEAMKNSGIVTIKSYEEKGRVVLAVQDQGEGIPDHIYKKLGTPFLTTKEAGTGLGLPVCYSIAERHRAEVMVDTGCQGTTFYIIFPEQPEMENITD